MQTTAPQTYSALAQAAREARGKDWPEAARLAAELRERFPDQPAGWQAGAMAAREMRDFTLAATLRREGEARFPAQSWPLAEAAWAARAQGDIDTALALTAALRERFPASPTGWQLGARLLRQRDRAAEAAAILRAAAGRFPTADWPARDGAEAATRQARDDRTTALLARLGQQATLPPPAPPGVVGVLGMHRSGTSLCTTILQRLGARLGGPLLPANAFNPEGYQEHAEVVETHQALLAALGADWDSPHLSDPIPRGFWTGAAAAAARAQLSRVLARETADGLVTGPSGGPWAFKDPRTPRFLPLWREVLAERGAVVGWVVSVRHPAAVAASLAARDGMPPGTAGLLWLEHYLDALRHAGDGLAALVHYEDWFTDPLAQARRLAAALGGGAGGAEEAAIRAAAASVRPDLRHDTAPELAGLPPLALAFHARLRAAGPSDGAALRREAAALWDSLAGLARGVATDPLPPDQLPPARPVRAEGRHEFAWPDGSADAVAYEAEGVGLLLCPDPAARLIRAIPCHDGAWGTARHVALPEGPPRLAVTFGDGTVTLSAGLGVVSLPWNPVAPVGLRCPPGLAPRLVLDLEGVATPPAAAPAPREPRRRSDLPARIEDATSAASPWAGLLEQADPAQGLLGWIARAGGSAAGLRVEAICRGQRIAHAHARAAAGAAEPARFRIGWHRFDAARVARIAAAHPDAPVRLVLAEADGMLRAKGPAPAIAEIARRIATAPPVEADPLERYETIADAGVFDADWYRCTYDPSGDAQWDPLAHYLAEGEARGFQPCLYLEPWRVAAALGLPSLQGALEAYLREPLKVPVPGLHFHQAWFRGTLSIPSGSIPSGSIPSGQVPLAALLARRPAVSPNPFFDLDAWRARHPGADVADPYEHFLAGPEGPAFRRRLARAVRRPQPHAVTPAGRVSVIVPNYNYARYLHVRLAGIMAQTAPLREVIVLDDASTDRSVPLAEAMAVQAGWPLRLVVNGRNGGSVVRQWHAGLSRAAGEMVWIAEADDLASPVLVERLAACLDADPEALFAFCDPAVVDATGEQVAADNRTYYARMGDDGLARSGMFPAADFAVRFLCPRNLVLNASAVLWRRSALERAFAALGEEAFGFTCAGDWRLYVAACGLGGTVHYLAEPLGSHRRHTGSVTSTLEKARHFSEIQRLHAVLTPLLVDRAAGLAAMEQYNRMLRRAWRLPEATA